MNSSKNYLRGLRPYLSVFVIIIALTSLESCKRDTASVDPDEPIETPEYAEYNLDLSGKKLIGKDVDSRWSPGEGTIWLSTDDKHERDRYGTLTLAIEEQPFAEFNPEAVSLAGALLSTSDCLQCGPGEPINGKLYSLIRKECKGNVSGYINVIATKESFIIVDSMCLTMKEGETGEEIEVTGTFTALNER